MNTFFIGDLHLGHAKIIEYTERPFSTVDEMDEQLIKNWNGVVSPKDEVYIIGDFALTGREKTEQYLTALKGNKYLIHGNHDYWTSNANCKKYVTWIKDYYELKENKRTWVLCHYPLYSWNKRRSGAIHLHAHTHRPVNLTVDMNVDEFENHHDFSPDIDFEIFNRYMCVSAECINYTPISLEEIRVKLRF